MLRNITDEDCLQRNTGVKQGKFQKLANELNRPWRAMQKRKQVAGQAVWSWRFARTFAAATHLQSALQVA